MIYIYAPVLTTGLPELAKALGAAIIIKHDGFNPIYKGKPLQLTSEDRFICWGRHIPVDIPALNADTPCLTDSEVNKTVLNGSGWGMLMLPPFETYKDFRWLRMLQREKLLEKEVSIVSKHLPNIAVYYQTHLSRYRMHIIGSKIVVSQKAKQNSSEFAPIATDLIPSCFTATAIQIISACKLDFGVVTLFKRNRTEYPIFHKVITNPALTSSGLIEAYATVFSDWANATLIPAVTAVKVDEIVEF